MTLQKLRLATAGLKKKQTTISIDVIRDWLEKQDAYTLNYPVRKLFARNPYTVTNLMYVWECDLLDVQSYTKYTVNYRYILSVIDVFSKFLHMIPLKKKRRPSVTSAFRSTFDDTKYWKRLPIWLSTVISK